MNDFILNTMLDAYETVVKLNTVTGELIFIKSKLRDVPVNTPMHSGDFAGDFLAYTDIHPDDQYLFEVYFAPDRFNRIMSSGNNGLFFAYRTFENDAYMWSSIYTFAPKDYSAENPNVLICRKLITETSADMMEILESYNRKILKCAKINVQTGEYRLIKQRHSEEYIKLKSSKEGGAGLIHHIEEELIHPDDLERFNHLTSPKYIIDYYAAGHSELNFFYRRKIGSFFRWVKLVITPATEYTPDKPVYTYIMENVDKSLTNLLDSLGQRQFFGGPESEDHSLEIYHENLLHVLSYMTHRYIDFYMIDLKKDLYIMYKIKPETVSGDMPPIGCYSEMSKAYVASELSPEQSEHLLQFATPKALMNMLKDRSNIEFSFTHFNGQLVTTMCTKVESENGIPTKVICATVPYRKAGMLRVQCFGNFDVFGADGQRIKFSRKQSKQLFAYLVDRQGYPVSTRDIVVDVLEKSPDDKTAVKYVSKLSQLAIKDLEAAGYTDIIIKEWNSLRVNTDKLDCDYYNLINGDSSYIHQYHNSYMKEYSWAEETNAEILNYSQK